MALTNPAGGLFYHARAWRFRDRWAPFREEVGDWLAEWEPCATRLLLIAPSAGYTLPHAWLRRFDDVLAVDVDPLAPRLFARQHPGLAVHWHIQDVFPFGETGVAWGRLVGLLREHPHHAVLFANILGQLEGLAQGPSQVAAVPKALGTLRKLLVGREWASFHDRTSGPWRPEIPDGNRHWKDDELDGDSHATEAVGEGLPCRLMAWEIAPGRWHTVEGCVGKRE